jgi:hypothetical protein
MFPCSAGILRAIRVPMESAGSALLTSVAQALLPVRFCYAAPLQSWLSHDIALNERKTPFSSVGFSLRPSQPDALRFDAKKISSACRNSPNFNLLASNSHLSAALRNFTDIQTIQFALPSSVFI